MMIKLGNFFFHYRNILFPFIYLTLFIPSPNLFSNIFLAIYIGYAVALSGQIIRVVTIGLQYIIRGGKNRQIYAEGLVTGGIFSHCRNPLYVGNILILLGCGIIANSLFFILLTTPVFLFIYHTIVLAEENFLLGKFGDEFIKYKNSVNRWIPNFKGVISTIKKSQFKWKRVIIKEYTSTFIWLTASVFLVMKNIYNYTDKVYFIKYSSFLFYSALFFVLSYFIVRYLKKSKIIVDN